MQKGNTLIFLLIGILVLVGGTYYLKFLKPESFEQRLSRQNPVIIPSISPEQNNKPTPDTKPQNGETANWKAYTNSTFSYSIKFPDTYEVPPQTDRQKNQLGVDTNICIVTKIDGKCSVVINSYKNTEKLSLENWVKKHEPPLSTYGGNAEVMRSSFNGYNALYARNETQVVYYLENNLNIFYIESSINQEDLAILATFKFL